MPKHLADKILSSRAALEGERKQVTVLFADVKGSMELAEQLDPQAFSQNMRRFFQILSEGVERFEGFVDKFTGDGVNRYLRQAIALDPSYALAYLGVAYYYVSSVDGFLAGSEPLPRAREAAEKALQLAPSLAEAHTWLGVVHWWYDRDSAAAHREFQTALKMQPELAPAHELYGWYLVGTG
jgi:class 3 adenylate cyclase